MWRPEDPQGNEAAKVKYEIVPYTRGVVLDLGCGPTKAFPHFIGIDNCADTALFGIQITPDVTVKDCADLSDAVHDASCDAVFSSHLLEHIVDTEAALRDWWRCLKIGGYLVLYLPHKDLYPNIGQLDANPDHKHDFAPLDIQQALASIGSWELVVEEVRDQGTEYSFLQVFKKRVDDGLHIRSCYETKPEKTACVVRYGGFGDMIQASNIFPELKRQGYHVTVMTTPKGQDILREDPHVDAWFIQDPDQVPNAELSAFWAVQARRFDRFINLSESVEGTLLALPGRANHAWPQAVRHAELNKNYLEWTAQLAELPYASEAKFYPSAAETAKVRRYLADIKNEQAGPLQPLELAPPVFFILWVLAGSSIHKFTPHQDTVISAILDSMPEAVVIFNGDDACQILEAGWENEPRVKCESGNMDIRASLSLAQQVDCVVGPETGVLNAVAFEAVPKVILLSHSSPDNLTRHWSHTAALTPEHTDCYPCHRLHYGRDFCPEHAATGAALCQANIAPERLYRAIRAAYLQWKNPYAAA